MGGMDWIIIIMIVLGVIQGYRKGLIKEAASLAGIILSLFVAYKFSNDLASVLQGTIPLPESWTQGTITMLLPVEKGIYLFIAFLLLFIVTKILISIIASILTGLANLPVLSQLNGIGGALFGFVKVFVVMMVAVNLLSLLPWTTGQEAVENSSLSQGILDITPSLGDSSETDEQE